MKEGEKQWGGRAPKCWESQGVISTSPGAGGTEEALAIQILYKKRTKERQSRIKRLSYYRSSGGEESK